MAKKKPKPQAEPVESVVSIDEMVDSLEVAGNEINDEGGEYWQNLANLRSYVSYLASDEFRAAWEKEVKAQYDKLQNEYEWVEEDVTQTHRVRELRYKNG